MRGRTDAWRRYYSNHPNVVASWAEQNGREPDCPCQKCKSTQLGDSMATVLNTARPFNAGDTIELYLNNEPQNVRVASWNAQERTVHCHDRRGRSVEVDWMFAETALRMGGRWVVQGVGA
jgi:hypothetical protein